MSRYGSSANDWPSSHETEAELRDYEDEMRRKFLAEFEACMGGPKATAQLAADLELLDEIDRREAEIGRSQ